MNEPLPPAGTGRARRRGAIAEFWGFLSHYRKWWLLPILMLLLVLGVLVVTQGTALAPFLYALF